MKESETVEEYLINKYSAVVDQNSIHYDLIKDLYRLKGKARIDTQMLQSMLPTQIRKKIDQLQTPMGFQQKSELLQWVVDSMRSEVMMHFEKSKMF